jgi:hypothetical protein
MNEIACKADPRIKVESTGPISIRYGHQQGLGVVIENTSNESLPVCLTLFSMMGSPLILIRLLDANGKVLHTNETAEIYPGANKALSKGVLPAHGKVSVMLAYRASTVAGQTNPISAATQAKWSIWVNDEFKEGVIQLKKKH